VAFVSNSFVFLLIGMREARQDFFSALPVVLLAIALVTLSRAAAVYSAAHSFRARHAVFPPGISMFCAGVAFAVRWHWRSHLPFGQICRSAI
jgi:NhaP-type Na+/H+ or K+/H+ antiporter